MFPSFAGTPEPEQTDVPFAYLTVKQLKRMMMSRGCAFYVMKMIYFTPKIMLRSVLANATSPKNCILL